MGFDLYGTKAKSKKGEYFRNNVWWWRRTWDFVVLVSPDILTADDIENGQWNNGYEYSEEKAIAIANRINEKIKDGTAKKYAKQVREEIAEAKENNTILEELTKKKYAEGYDWGEAYPFTISNLKEFATFAKNSGGFTIC
jgi:hypothetical protein